MENKNIFKKDVTVHTELCLWRFGVKLPHRICDVSGAPLSSSGLEEENIQNKWMNKWMDIVITQVYNRFKHVNKST